ncbi:hypothetical protein M758_12G066000 [Ceratodon purpureus]|nr:hypothetical protein M758_12G066000 [Ceratodon purpureus]
MADTDASLKEAKSYLSARLPRGSIIIVTARSKELLMRLRSYINENQCLEMPELLHEEAKSLFIKAADFEVGNEVDEQLMLRCVERCRFSKHDSNASHHYHPLALDVLGRQLGCIDPKEWASQLDMIDDDIFNQLRENDHPIFSILRKSFDTLSPEDQQLFLDVALFIPRNNLHEVECTRFEWLRMVHSIPSIADVVTRLRKLKTKSLLERLEDGSNPRIGMHDLWRAFCIAETNHGGFVCQRWVYESKNRCEIVETSPSGTCWENVNRMAFIDDLEQKLGRVNFSHFPNVTVLKILGTLTSEMLVLDLSGLIHLKSLQVRTRAPGNIVTRGLPRSLVYLHWQVEGMDCDAPQLLEQIAFLEQLECLRFIDYGGFELPDVSSMVSLRWATFRNCENAVTVTGLSSKLTKLQWLNFEGCSELRSCSGVDDLVALKMLDFEGCARLKLPNLRKLRNLRTLCITGCLSINEVLGLGDLVALEEFYADSVPDLSELPDMSKLTNLKYLNLRGCFNLGAVPGFDRLISLEELDANFQEVEEWPNLQQLTKLKFVRIFGWNIAGLRGLVNLAMLHTLEMSHCSGVDELPDLRSLISLERFFIKFCEFKSLSGLSNSSMLMTLCIHGCEKLESIPDLRRLTRLDCLSILDCGAMLGCWNCAFGQAEEDSWRSDDSNIRSGLPNSQRLTALQQSFSEDCGVVHVTVIGAFSQLERLNCQSLQVAELPDLRIFPRLKILQVDNCGSLTKFTSGEITNASLELRLPRPSSLTTLPELGSSSGLSKRDLDAWDGITVLKDSGTVLTALTRIDVNNCNVLQVFPDLGMFLALEFLDLQGCGGLTTLGSSMLLPALKLLNLIGCSALESLPDLGMFPALEELLLHGCCRLTTLSSSVPLTALKPLDIGSCSGLESLPDMGMFPSLRRLIIDGLYGLTTLSSSVALPALHCISLPNCSGLKALPDMRMFSALYTLRLDGCRELAKLSASVPLPILHELSLRNCAGLEALPDLGLFPVLEKLVLSGCCGLKTLNSSLPVPALRHLNIDGCSGLEALPDLAYCPALEELLLNGCWELTTLSSSVSLPVLKWLDVRRCWSLSGDDLDQLRGLCPQCEVRYDVIKDYVALGDECVQKNRRSRMLKCFR